MTKVLAVIPARHGSSRFPGKPLALIRGKAMILWVLERVKLAKGIDRVLVATDDDRIAKVVRSGGGEAVITESDLPSGTDRIAAALKGQKADIVINVQGDEPLVDPLAIEQLLTPMLADPELEMATLATPLTRLEDLQDPNIVKVICNKHQDAIYFSRFPIPYSRTNAAAPFESLRHLGLYAYRHDFLLKFCAWPNGAIEMCEALEQLRALEQGARIRVVRTEHQSHAVDRPEDIAKIEKLMEGQQ